MADPDPADGIYAGLRTVTDNQFPRSCERCGTVFQDLQELIGKTSSFGDSSGLEDPELQNPGPVRLARVCRCDAMIVVLCSNRRDLSPQGAARRRLFDEILAKLLAQGVPEAMARSELRRMLHGQGSPLLDSFPDIAAELFPKPAVDFSQLEICDKCGGRFPFKQVAMRDGQFLCARCTRKGTGFLARWFS